MRGLSKAAAAAFAAVAIVAVAACGTDDNSSSGSAGTTETTTGGVAPAGQRVSGGGDAITFESEGFSCATGTLRSSGSTAQGKVMAGLIAAYNAKCGASINDYGGGGSGQGVTDFLAKQTDFGGSDSAMDADQLAQARADRCAGSDAINLPMVTGPIAVAYHLTGVDTLVLTPTVLSKIFARTITTWNDKEIAALNPDVTLPDLAITTVHRSEDSGTTDNFTRYLAAAGGWTFPGGKGWTAPGGTGAQGSDGVSKAVASTEGAIGYVEWGYAQQDKLAMAKIDNGAGPVALTAKSAAAAVQAATVTGKGNDLALSLDYATTSPGAYPVILVTYELVCTGGNGDHADLLRSFMGYAATDGQAGFVDLGAAPLPGKVQEKVIDAIKGLS